MELTPSQVSAATFSTVRKGYDPAEVSDFLAQAAKALEDSQQHATAMEARARAAVARLQEVTTATATADATAPTPAPLESPPPVERPRDELRVSADEAETISRTLLLAQRTADTTVAEALLEADGIKQAAQSEAETTIDSTREMSAKLMEESRIEARKESQSERAAAENELQSLLARRSFLTGDVDQLESFLESQRDRLRSAARQIEALCERIPAGLGEVGRPALSAADDEPGEDTAELFRPPGKLDLALEESSAEESGTDESSPEE
jgi:DivIVA domain-containing protein